MSGVDVRELAELTPGALALLLVEVEGDRELEELRVAVLGWRGGELPSGEGQEGDDDQML